MISMKDLNLKDRINDQSKSLKSKDEHGGEQVAKSSALKICSNNSTDPNLICDPTTTGEKENAQNDKGVNHSNRESVVELLEFESALKSKYSSYHDNDSYTSDNYIKSSDENYDLIDIDHTDSWSHASESETTQLPSGQYIPPEIAMMHLEAELLLDAMRQGISPRTQSDDVTDNTHFSSFSVDVNDVEEDDLDSLFSYFSDDDGMKGEVQKLNRSVTSLRMDLANASMLNIGLRKTLEMEKAHQSKDWNHFKFILILISFICPYHPYLDILCGTVLLF